MTDSNDAAVRELRHVLSCMYDFIDIKRKHVDSLIDEMQQDNAHKKQRVETDTDSLATTTTANAGEDTVKDIDPSVVTEGQPKDQPT